MQDQWIHKIFSITNQDFGSLALEIFQFQYRHNPVYKAYADLLKINPAKIASVAEIPFLPIRFFKTHSIKTTEFEPQQEFESSGTGGTVNSHHFVKDIELYRQSFLRGFELVYGPVNEWCILGLLPSYLERENSSLVFMVKELMERSRFPTSSFYLYDHDKLYTRLKELESAGQRTLLIGVSFALLDFSEKYSLPLQHTIIVETGGMKGRKEELVRTELHELLSGRFGVSDIHSEYGMTELLSQAYSKGSGIFNSPPWMKVLIRDEEDPLSIEPGAVSREPGVGTAIRGAINVIDLANVYSCAFIATDDAGMLYGDGNFEVTGRLDNSDVRGCSLMAF